MRHFKVVIVGGGVAGLMCARTLKQSGFNDFVLITKDFGGRVITAENSGVNYGAYFVTSQYKSLSPFIEFGRRIKKHSLLFVKAHKHFSLFSWHTVPYIFVGIKFLAHLTYFRFHFRKFRKNCLRMTQKQAVERDEYLHALFFEDASVYIKRHGFQSLVHEYIDEMGNAMSFTYPRKASAFVFLQWISEMLLFPLYEYRLDFQKMSEPFKSEVLLDSVSHVLRDASSGYVIKTSHRTILADILVMATEPWVANELLGIKRPHDIVHAYLWHAKGMIRKAYAYPYVLFTPKADEIVIAHQKDGSFIVYSHTKEIDLERFFIEYEVIGTKNWDPAFFYRVHDLIEMKHEGTRYLIGGHNLEGLEDAALTGVYAAKDILRGHGSEK